ncbi:MAG: PQQ-binding-like beta-propeller repeat protein [Propionibacteriaceae bacterium]
MWPSAPERPWAPFPVQDWYAYRRTAGWREYLASRRPPPGPRTRPVTIVAMVVCCALVAGLLAWTARVPAQRRVGWVPVDGSSQPVSLGGTASGQGTVENAVLSWQQLVQSMPPSLSLAAFAHSSVRKGDLWRQSVTEADLTTPGAVAVLTTGPAVSLVIEYAAGGPIRVFAPALPLLAPDARPGASWTEQGTVTTGSGAKQYRAALTAEAAPDSCLTVAGSLTIVDPEPVSWTFCPGRGMVAGSVVGMTFVAADGGATMAAAADQPAPTAVAPQGQPAPMLPRTTGLNGSEQLTGTPKSIAPLALGSDRLVRVAQSGQDLVLFDVNGTDLTERRRLHPGGTVLTAAAVPGGIVATTSARTVVAWTSNGQRLWSADLDDAVAQPPVAVGPDEIVTVSVLGQVVGWDATTGRRRWAVDVHAPVDLTPAVGATVVIVADQSGALTALDPGSGAVRWQVDAGDAFDAVSVLSDSSGSQHVVASVGGFLVSFAVADGRRVWSRRLTSATESLRAAGAGGVLVLGSLTVQAFGWDGSRRWQTSQGCEPATDGAGWLACWHKGNGLILDPATGASVATVPLPKLTGDPQGLVQGGRVWLFDTNAWGTWSWGDR